MMELTPKVVMVALLGLSGSVSGAWMGGIKVVEWADTRYAPMDAVEDLAWSALKREIRDIRERISQAQSEAVRQSLQADLEDTIDRLCKNYPEDRECQ